MNDDGNVAVTQARVQYGSPVMKTFTKRGPREALP